MVESAVDKERAEFEKQFKGMGYGPYYLRPSIIAEEYAEAATECAWRIWQAARTLDRATLAERDAERERLRATLQRLADAADLVGVKFFDTDTMDEPVEEMQAATQEARAALSYEPQHQGDGR